MKRIWLLLVLVFFCLKTFSQKIKVDTQARCSDVANELSYYWKLDSAANNGFRRYTYQKFLHSKPDSMALDTLLARLGKPNEITRTNKGIEYLYYYFDIKTMPKEYNAPLACWYIGFRFSRENYLLEIWEGDIDR